MREKKIKGAETINLDKGESVGVSGGLQLIRSSPLLQMILILIICMQMSATMLDFQFNSYLQTTISNMDQRTAFLGRFFGYVNLINVFLQFLGTFGIVRWLGLKKDSPSCSFCACYKHNRIYIISFLCSYEPLFWRSKSIRLLNFWNY